jgi:hypothetical protein
MGNYIPKNAYFPAAELQEKPRSSSSLRAPEGISAQSFSANSVSSRPTAIVRTL